MKSKKLLSLLLALLMMLSVVPMYASAAETPTVTTWPTATVEVGQSYSNAVIADNGVASVPGTFSVTVTRKASRPITYKATAVFTPTDTENYAEVTGKISIATIACQNPVLTGGVASTSVCVGEAIGSSTLSISPGSTITAYEHVITGYARNITWDNPNEIFTAAGTYERPVTVAFSEIKGTAYAVPIKTTAKITVTKLPTAKITSLPTVTNKLCTEGDTASSLVLSGGTTDIAGKFAVTNPDQPLVVGTNIVNLTFTPDDLTNYEPSTVDISFTLKQGAKVPENLVLEVPYSATTKFSNIKNMNFPESGIEPADASIYVMSVVDQPELYNTVPGIGEYKVTINIYHGGGLIGENVEVTLKVVASKSTGTFLGGNALSDIQDDGSYLVRITHSSRQEAPVLNGTTRVKVNGEVIAEYPVSKSAVETKYVATKSGQYVVSVDYVADEKDYVTYEKNELTLNSFDFEITMPRTITATNCDVSGNTAPDGKFIPGTEVRASSYVVEDLENLEGWIFLDDAGNEFTPEGYRVTDPSGAGLSIAFTMPNHDMTVKPIINEIIIEDNDDSLIPGFNLPEIEFDANGSHKYDLVNMIQNLIAKLKDFIYSIGAFFGAIDAEDVNNAVGDMVNPE